MVILPKEAAGYWHNDDGNPQYNPLFSTKPEILDPKLDKKLSLTGEGKATTGVLFCVRFLELFRVQNTYFFEKKYFNGK
jgi:hypothetical protein